MLNHYTQRDTTMAKKAAPKPAEPAVESTGTTFSKSEAARQAIAAGFEGPEEATDFIHKQFGIEMSRSHFSAVKSQIKAKNAAGGTPALKGRPGRKPNSSAPVVTSHAARAQKTTGNGASDLLDALSTMKPLIAQFGADQVKKMVDLLE
jgi:hypothetical protein